MNISFTFRHMDPSPAIEGHANKKLEKIINFLKNDTPPIFIEFVLEASKLRAKHTVELRINTPNYLLVTSQTGPDFYLIIDEVIDIMHQRLLDAKQESIDKRKTVGRHDEFKKQR